MKNKTIASMKLAVNHSRLVAEIYVRILEIAFSLGRISRRAENKQTTGLKLVVCHPAQGNIGDLSMAQAAANFEGENVLLIHDAKPGFFDEKHNSPNFREVSTEKVFQLHLWKSVESWYRLGTLSSSVSSFSLIGADTLDGNYSLFESLAKIRLTATFEKLNIPTKIFGFSWSDKWNSTALAAIKRLKGTNLLVRDPLSHQRLKDENVGNITLVADLAFTLPESSAVASQEVECIALLEDLNGRNFVVVNMSGLWAIGDITFDAFYEFTQQLLDRDLTVVLLAHVTGKKDSDLISLKRLFAKLDSPNVYLYSPNTPAAVTSVVSKATAVITCRMHLAVAALRFSVPVLCLATNGKVEGLFKSFGIPEFAIEVSNVSSQSLKEKFDILCQDSHEIRNRISTALPSIQARAWKNFEAEKLAK